MFKLTCPWFQYSTFHHVPEKQHHVPEEEEQVSGAPHGPWVPQLRLAQDEEAHLGQELSCLRPAQVPQPQLHASCCQQCGSCCWDQRSAGWAAAAAASCVPAALSSHPVHDGVEPGNSDGRAEDWTSQEQNNHAQGRTYTPSEHFTMLRLWNWKVFGQDIEHKFEV